jgi:hypothetical protein
MERLLPKIIWGGKAVLTMVGILAIWRGLKLMFEYGEGLADLSTMETLCLVAAAGMEWRLVARSLVERRVLRSIVEQLFRTGALTLGFVLFDWVHGKEILSVGQIAFTVLLAIHMATPKPNKVAAKMEVPN